MLKGIHITDAKNKSLINSIWTLDDNTHDVTCIQGFNKRHNYTNLRELGLVDFDLIDLPNGSVVNWYQLFQIGDLYYQYTKN